MKHRVMVLAGALLIGGASALAQADHDPYVLYVPGLYSHLKIDQVVKNFQANLTSPIPGIVETTLGHIIWLRLVRPDVDLNSLQDAIVDVADNGPTAAIRYRASLASMVLYSPSLFASLKERSYARANDLFAGVSGKAQESLIGQNH